MKAGGTSLLFSLPELVGPGEVYPDPARHRPGARAQRRRVPVESPESRYRRIRAYGGHFPYIATKLGRVVRAVPGHRRRTVAPWRMRENGAGVWDVTVVLPCLDEREAVGLCVAQAREALAQAGLSGEVVVVDNGSKDGSPEVAARAGARVIHESRRGYGRALRTGFENARGDVVVMADADGTYDLAKIGLITRPVIDGEADMVLATRLDGATSETMPFLHRYVGTPVITFLTSRASGKKVTKDSQTGYRAFRRDGVMNLGLAGNGMELASEMLIKAGRAGYRIVNIPGGYSPRIGDSKLDTWSDGWRHLKLILLLAPDLVLIGPGLVLAILGLFALALGFAQPAGVGVGSARWQPVFFSGIALVLGCQVFFAGAVVAHNSPLTPASQTRFGFLRAPALARRSLGLGLIFALLGAVIDAGLFVSWVSNTAAAPTTGWRFGFASLAQSLLILGGSLAVFGVVARYLRPPIDAPSGAIPVGIGQSDL